MEREIKKYNQCCKTNNNMSEKKSYKEIAEELWDLLDSIDSLPDMIHPSNEAGHEKCWKMMVRRAEKRHKLLKTDGYNLSLIKHK